MIKKFSFIIFLGCVVAAGGIWWLKHSPIASSVYDLRVVCTTGMVADVVARVAGDRVFVETLMGPGVDPHLYRAREGDMHKIGAADIVFYNGLHLEGKMAALFDQMKVQRSTVGVAEKLPVERLLPSGFEGLYDPHVWFDIELWSRTPFIVAQALAEADPAGKEGYYQRACEYTAELKKLDKDMRSLLSVIPQEKRILVTAHDAFEYFGKAYGFTVLGLQGISTDAEITIHDVRRLSDFVIEHKVPAIFAENSIPVRYLQAVQDAIAARGENVRIGKELFSDSLGDRQTPEGKYPGMVLHNVQTIIEGIMGSEVVHAS